MLLLKNTYTTFNPATLVDKWNTLFLFSGGKRFVYQLVRAEAFKLRTPIRYKSRFVTFLKNHWVLKPKTQVWQKEFF
jgi:hypothetical protein